MSLDKDKRNGIIGTIIFHMILILSLFFLALRTPLPLPGEEGVEVNLGDSEKGMGNVQPDVPAQMQQAAPAPQQIEQAAEEVKQEVITQDIEEAPALPDPVKEKPKEKKPEPKKETPVKEVVKEPVIQPEKTEEKPKEPEVNQRALFKGTGTSKTDGGSEGITGDPGDQGKPDGLKDVKRYDGQGGKGDGPAFSLGGRGSKYLERPTSDFQEQGDIVVDIWVDPNGVVKRAQISTRGTTIVDPNLRNVAVKAALNSTFSEDPAAPELQKGTITYTFIVRR
ncbi:MAG: hypothetical protein Q8S18_13540 [Bacteroidales bacterium]|nr:hypothetical protein [Bacteroidales bacterium]